MNRFFALFFCSVFIAGINISLIQARIFLPRIFLPFPIFRKDTTEQRANKQFSEWVSQTFFPIRVSISGEIFLIQKKDFASDFVFKNAERILRQDAPTICYLDSDMTEQWITNDAQSLQDILKQWVRDKQSKGFVTLTEC